MHFSKARELILSGTESSISDKSRLLLVWNCSFQKGMLIPVFVFCLLFTNMLEYTLEALVELECWWSIDMASINRDLLDIVP